jgi:pimeloyl-ACP methyl ester carboxylesterase
LGGKHAFLLFCYPFPLKLKKYQSAFLSTGRSSYLDFEGKKIAQYQWGCGEKKILCLHGWQSSSYRWRKYIQTFNHDVYTITCLDAPAHGKSDGKLFNVLMYARLIEHYLTLHPSDYILSHSLGAFSSMYLFAHKPHYAPRKIAALGTPSSAHFFIDEYIRILGVSNTVRDNLVRYFKDYSKLDPSDFDTKLFAKHQNSEGLIIHDEHDQDVPFEYAREMAKLWKNAKFIATRRLGHKLRDQSVVDCVVQFFED